MANFPMLAISDIMKKWRDALKNSTELSTYCVNKYGKEPTIFVGIDARDLPDEEYCPFIILFPGTKMEGIGITPFTYQLPVMWVISSDEVVETDNVIEQVGTYDVDDIGAIIIEACNASSPDYPITQVDYQNDLEAYIPQFVGKATMTINIPVTMGVDLVY